MEPGIVATLGAIAAGIALFFVGVFALPEDSRRSDWARAAGIVIVLGAYPVALFADTMIRGASAGEALLSVVVLAFAAIAFLSFLGWLFLG